MSLVNHLGFGCVSLTSLPFKRDAIRLLELVYEKGILHFDTAPLYGSGYSEKILGEFLKGKRNKITITTKFGLNPAASKQIPVSLALPLNFLKKYLNKKQKNISSLFKTQVIEYREINLKDIKLSFEKSMKSLQTNYIDYFFLHEALPHFLTDEALEYLLRLKKAGDVLNIGIATSSISIESLNSDNLLNWDILQYENNLRSDSNHVLNKFKQQKHFYHSLFKFSKYESEIINAKDLRGLLIAKALRSNLNGKILFGTSSRNNLINNLIGLEKYDNYSLAEINQELSNAFH